MAAEALEPDMLFMPGIAKVNYRNNLSFYVQIKFELTREPYFTASKKINPSDYP